MGTKIKEEVEKASADFLGELLILPYRIKALDKNLAKVVKVLREINTTLRQIRDKSEVIQ